MVGRQPSTARRSRLVHVAGLGLLAAVALAGAGCTGDDDPEPPPETPGSVPLELTVGVEVTELDAETSDNLQAEVSEALGGYVVSAFLGDYPRADFVEALEWFTSGGAALATDHLDQLTADQFGAAQSVVATDLRARLAVFAPEGEPAGLSAGIDFTFAVEGDDGTTDLHLTGRLLLTDTVEGWRIFGYRVDREVLPSGSTS